MERGGVAQALRVGLHVVLFVVMFMLAGLFLYFGVGMSPAILALGGAIGGLMFSGRMELVARRKSGIQSIYAIWNGTVAALVGAGSARVLADLATLGLELFYRLAYFRIDALPWSGRIRWFIGSVPDQPTGCYGHPENRSRPIGSAPEDRSPDGVFDCAGNVAEWVEDHDNAAAYDPGPSPSRPTTDRVYRGGDYGGATATKARLTRRHHATEDQRLWGKGFRTAR